MRAHTVFRRARRRTSQKTVSCVPAQSQAPAGTSVPHVFLEKTGLPLLSQVQSICELRVTTFRII